MNEEIANIQDIKTKRDLPLATLALKGCKGRGCVKTEFRSPDNHLGVRDFLIQLPAHQTGTYSQTARDFWRDVCLLSYIPKFDRRGRAGSLTVWQFGRGAMITL